MASAFVLFFGDTGTSGGKASAPGRIRHSGYREHRDIADSSEYGKYNNGIIFKPCAGDGSGRNCSRHTCLPSNEDLAGSVANTGNSHRKLLCLRIAGFWAGEDLPAPSGGNGNGAAGTGDHRCGLLVLLLMLRSFRGQDLNYVPGGKVLRAFGKTLRLL